MLKKLPDILDLSMINHAQTQYQGSWSAAKLERLSSAVNKLYSPITIELTVDLAQTLRPGIAGRIEAQIDLECQRCLLGFKHTVSHDFELDVKTDTESYTLDGDENRIDIVSFIEDELLLAIPSYPTHQDIKDCDPRIVNRAIEYVPEKKRNNPFEILKTLKSE